MLVYLLLTYLLSAIGVLLYLSIKGRLDFANRKFALLSILGLSVFIPLLFTSSAFDFPGTEVSAEYAAFTEATFTDFCPKDEVLDACYSLAQSEAEFCNCESIAIEDIVVYESNFWYNVLHLQETAFWLVIGIGAFMILLLLVVKVRFLKKLINSSQKQSIYLSNEEFVILRNNEKMGVGSFQLKNKYIIWQDEMESLSQSDCQSIIWHEISHILQKDTWIKIATNFLQSIWILNPAFYFIKAELDQLSEYIADQFAIRKSDTSAKDYARLLLRMSEGPKPQLVHAFKKGELKTRVQHILQGNKPQTNWIKAPLCLALAICFSAFTHVSTPALSMQVQKLHIYEAMSTQSDETGKKVFCKNCLIKETLEICQPEEATY